MKKPVATCIGILVALTLYGQTPELCFRRFTVNEGSPNSGIRAIVQDGVGFMWLGTGKGLFRYDGYGFEECRYRDSLDITSRVPEVTRLTVTGDTLWIGTLKGAMTFDLKHDLLRPFRLATQDGLTITSRVGAIRQDPSQMIWIATLGQGLFRYDPAAGQLIDFTAGENVLPRELSQHEVFTPNGRAVLPGNSIPHMDVDAMGNLWLYLSGQGIFCMDPSKGGALRLVAAEKQVNALCCDSQGNLWIGTQKNGVVRYHIHSGQTERLLGPGTPLYAVHIHDIMEYQPGVVLVTSDNGLSAIDMGNGVVRSYPCGGDAPDQPNETFLYALYKDRENGLWVSSFNPGLNYSSPYFNRFDLLVNCSGGRITSALCEDPDGSLWIGSDDGGVAHYDPRTSRFENYMPSGAIDLSFYNVHALLREGERLWVGTFTGGLNVYDLHTRKMRYYSDTNGSGLGNRSVYSLLQDASGSIWAGTLNGLNRYNPASDNFTWVSENRLPPGTFVHKIVQDPSGRLWLMGLNTVYCCNSITGEMHEVPEFMGIRCNSMCLNGSNLLIGTMYRGLWMADTSDSVPRFAPVGGMEEFDILAVVAQGNRYWFSSDKGIVMWEPANGTKTIFGRTEGDEGSIFCRNSGLRASNGRIYFGGIGGIASFDPEKIAINTSHHRVALTSMAIYYNDIRNDDPESPLSESITYTRRATLTHRQSTVSFSFSTLSYIAPAKTRYAYRLEGVDPQWVYPAGDRKAHYTNLSAGKYILKAKATNNDGVWGEEVELLEITVRPAALLSTAAKIAYAVAVVMALLGVLRYIIRRSERHHAEYLKKLNAQKEAEVYHAKIDFFTGITHEIRTPLSLIVGPVNSLLSDPGLSPGVREELRIVERNSDRLLSLVTQLLDFRKIESQAYALRFEMTDMAIVLRDLCNRFEQAAGLKDVRLELDLEAADYTLCTDVEAATKIFSNLVNNAVKYARGQVTVRVSHPGPIMVTVSDNGCGIPAEEMDSICTPFFRSPSGQPRGTSGTGLGLSLAKSLADMLDWEIRFLSTAGTGTQVTVVIPVAVDERPAPQQMPPPAEDARAEQILLVEDDPDMRAFVAGRLERDYAVRTAASGEQALELLATERFDMVISDVMMPGIDGLELCAAIKGRLATSHIPVILLTARTNLDTRLSGLQQGADAYMGKPLHTDLLLSQVRNIFENRHRNIERFARSPLGVDLNVPTNSEDERFIEKLNRYIWDNISNSELDIEAICDTFALGRTSIFNKIRTLCGCSPIEYVRLLRLKRSAELLLTSDYRVGEVAFIVGFNTPSYFSKCFLRQFGVLPADFAKAQRASINA